MQVKKKLVGSLCHSLNVTRAKRVFEAEERKKKRAKGEEVVYYVHNEKKRL